MTEPLIEIPLVLLPRPVPEIVERLAAEARRRAKAIDCFDYVPSSAAVLFQVLDALPRGRFCEWGSGLGVGVGIASWLGFEATGIELHAGLASAARQLLADFHLAGTIHTGSQFDIDVAADSYFVYCWFSQTPLVEAHFVARAPRHARLLICSGAEDIRCKVRNDESDR